MHPFSDTIRDIHAGTMLAACRAARPSRVEVCRAKRDEWLRRCDTYRKAGRALKGFDPMRVRAARLALICEMRAKAWHQLADGDAAGAWFTLVNVLRLEQPMTKRRPPLLVEA